VVCLSVCRLVMFVSPGKTAEPIEMLIRWLTHVDPRKHVLDGSHGRTNPFVTRGVTRGRCGLLTKFFGNLLITLLSAEPLKTRALGHDLVGLFLNPVPDIPSMNARVPVDRCSSLRNAVADSGSPHRRTKITADVLGDDEINNKPSDRQQKQADDHDRCDQLRTTTNRSRVGHSTTTYDVRSAKSAQLSYVVGLDRPQNAATVMTDLTSCFANPVA